MNIVFLSIIVVLLIGANWAIPTAAHSSIVNNLSNFPVSRERVTIDVTNGSTLELEANTLHSLILESDIQVDVSVETSINLTVTEYESNPRTDDGLIGYQLLSNYIAFNSSLEDWQSLPAGNISKQMSQTDLDNLVIGMEKVWFLSYDEGAKTYEAPDGINRINTESKVITTIENLARVFVLAQGTERDNNNDGGGPVTSPGFTLFPLLIGFILIATRKFK